MEFKNSIYEYTYKECKQIKMPRDSGYTWYDVAMFDTCKKMSYILSENTHLFNTSMYTALKELNDFMLLHVVQKDKNSSMHHHAEFLNKLCTVQLLEIEVKYTDNPSMYKELVEAFRIYYNCLCEYKTLNNLESDTLKIIECRELFGYPHIRNLFDIVSRVCTKISPNSNDLKLISNSYINARFESEDAMISKESKNTTKQYLNSVENYINDLKRIIQNKNRK